MHGLYLLKSKPISSRSPQNFLYHRIAEINILYSARSTCIYNTFFLFSYTTCLSYTLGAIQTKISTSFPVIFIIIFSSSLPVGTSAWINALGISADITSRFSLASITNVNKTPSNDAVGLAESSQDNQSLVSFPL